MKFGQRLSDSLYPEWKKYYLDYSGLKKELKKPASGADWDDADEAAFIRLLEEELKKIYHFQETKVSEIWTQLKAKEAEVNRLMEIQTRQQQQRDAAAHEGADSDDEEAENMRQSHIVTDEEEQQQSGTTTGSGEEEGDETDDEEDIQNRFLDIEVDIETLIWETHEIAKYTTLCHTGFTKITKKHDKLTGFPLKQEFISVYLEKLPFHRLQYDELIIELSKLYNLVRTRGKPITGDAAAGGTQTDFVRQTTKYWVHPDNLVNLKLAILKHLPVLVFNPKKDYQSDDSAISSIYFDNEDLDLYLGRLEKTEGAEAIRLRWYGGMDNKQIFVERKTHREDWTGEKSVKARFPIKEHQVNDYLSGKLKMDSIFEAQRAKSKRPQDIDNNIRLAREVQDRVQEKHLQPVMRTFYNRTAFQLPGDARVRISLDTNLTLVREDNWDGQSRAGSNWRRMDIGVDWPFPQLSDQDVHRFPYGVLEVKLQTQAGQEPPEWAKELVSSHLVEAVPKFSKFIHGCSTLLQSRVPLVPFWLPQMDMSILKPETPSKKAAIISRPGTASRTTASSSAPKSPGSSDGQDEVAGDRAPLLNYTEPVSDDEGDDENDPQQVTLDEGGVAGVSASEAAEAKAYREQHKNSPSNTGAAPSAVNVRSTQNQNFPKLTPKNLERLLKAKYQQGEGDDSEGSDQDAQQAAAKTSSGIQFVNSFRAPRGKMVSVPIRIEPKVYFANERTFLSWIELAVLISAVGVGLMNFGRPDDPIALAAGISFTIAALLIIIYSGYNFMWRALKIRKRQAVNYQDPIGPPAICALLLASVVINFAWRLSDSSHAK